MPPRHLINLSEITESSLSAMELLIKENGGTLRRKIISGVSIKMNPEAYRLILENLLTNAVKYSLPRNTAPAAPREIFVELYQEDGCAILSVKDKGPGVPLSERKKIFIPFFRGTRSRKEQIPGSGLGLHLVEQTVKLLGGKIEIKSPCFPEEPEDHQGLGIIIKIPFIPVLTD